MRERLDEGFVAEWHVHFVFGQDYESCVRYEASMINWLHAHKQKSWLNAYDPMVKKIGMTGRVFTDEHKAKIAEGNRGWKHTEETKAVMREKKLGRKLSDEHKAKIGAASRGRAMPEEAKAAISEKLKGRVFTLEWREKIAEAKRGKKRSGGPRGPSGPNRRTTDRLQHGEC